MDLTKGKEVYFAHIIPSFGTYECIHMKIRTKFENMIVLANKNITYPVAAKDYSTLLYDTKSACDKYLAEQKELHKGEKIYDDVD